VILDRQARCYKVNAPVFGAVAMESQ